MRYQIPGWEELTLQQKEYAYHLSEAAKWGRDIHWDQNCKWNLPIRHVVENILNNYDGDLAGIERYYNELLKDGGGTTNWDEGISLSWKDCVWNENWEDFEMVRNYADIIFE
jgi:hypothetical protein